ncbi:hypothetical protein [Thermobifida fusca]
MPREEQLSLFSPDLESPPLKPPGDQLERMRVLITVKAAPTPSKTYGETVCVAGLRLDPDCQGWVRLYPINFRALESEDQFNKYDVVSLFAKPSRLHDQRPESWRPRLDSLKIEKKLKGWKKRIPYISGFIEESMCRIYWRCKEDPQARSLAAIRPKRIYGIEVAPHPPWTPEEQRKIDKYVNQLALDSSAPRTALEAPRFAAWYRYTCWQPECRGHRQRILDWELVALQRRFRPASDQELTSIIKEKFFEEMCAPTKDTVFFVGNQAKRRHTFSVLGIYYPDR